MRAGLTSVCEPLIATLRQRARIGPRALWIAAAETCASVLVDALSPGTPVKTARDDVQALIGNPDSLLRAKPEIILIDAGEQCGLGLLGNDCCSNFKLAGESYSSTCPHRPRQERLAALQTWLAERARN